MVVPIWLWPSIFDSTARGPPQRRYSVAAECLIWWQPSLTPAS